MMIRQPIAVGEERLEGTVAGGVTAKECDQAYSRGTRLAWTGAAALLGVLVAGFWNYKAVDGFGRGVVAGNALGDTHALASTFAVNGVAFGVLFGVVAGLAATFTACNCVVFAMLPGLAGGLDRSASRQVVSRALALFVVGVVGVGLVYGAFVGSLGGSGAARLNAVRLAQAETVFSVLGGLLLLWGAIEFGFLGGLTDRLPKGPRTWLASSTTKIFLMGLIVGCFAVGRPYPVFRDLLTYAASAHNPLYGALVMGVQGLGQIALLIVIFLLMVWGPGRRITNWAAVHRDRTRALTAAALVAGGSFFVYYWGIALVFHVGQWGFKLGLYS